MDENITPNPTNTPETASREPEQTPSNGCKGAIPADKTKESLLNLSNSGPFDENNISEIPRMQSMITMMAAAHYEAGDHWVRIAHKPYHLTPLDFQVESERRMTAAFESMIHSLGYGLTYMPVEEDAAGPGSDLSSDPNSKPNPGSGSDAGEARAQTSPVAPTRAERAADPGTDSGRL